MLRAMFTMRMRVQRFSGLEVDNQLPTLLGFSWSLCDSKNNNSNIKDIRKEARHQRGVVLFTIYIKRKDIIRTLLMRYVPT